MADKARNRFYLRTIDAYNFTMIDMDRLASVAVTKTIPIEAFNNVTSDSTQLLLNKK